MILFSVGVLGFIHFYPVGDWITGPFMEMFILIPCILIQVLLLTLIISWKKKTPLLVIQGLIVLVLAILLVNYILTH